MLSRLKTFKGVSVCALGVMLLVMISRTPVQAQVGTGSITGTVTDNTGAVVVGASVTVTSAETGIATHLVSNTDGRYVAPDLNVGAYNITVQAKGFKAEKHVGVVVLVGRQMVVDFSLTVGEQSETITVQGEASQVETATSEISAQVGQAQMRELPLNGRDFGQLILLAPGVQQVTSSVTGSFFGRENSFSVDGSRPSGQALLLDGAEIQTFWNRGGGNSILGTSLGVDAIGEFQVLTNTYSARFGGNGSVMNATTRSGTNQVHGSGFEFIRNSALDAKNYFDSASRPIPAFRRNQFGGTLGGPIKKDKLFYFVNYEGLRQLLGETMEVVVPDAQARLGIITTPSGTTNYNPLNPAVAAVLAVWPALSPAAVDLGDGIADDLKVGYQPAGEDYVNTRWDYTLGSKDNLFARYVFDNGTLTEPFSEGPGTPLGLFPEISKGRNQYLTIGERRVASSTLVNEARVNFVRTYAHFYTNTSYSALDFFPGEGRQNGYLTIGGLNQLGPDATAPGLEVQNTFSFGDDVVWVRGKHTISFGADLERQQSNTYNNALTNGDWTFTNLQALLLDEPSSVVGAVSGEDDSYRGFREWHTSPYFQDDWKVLPTLTLNLGLRYDFVSNPTAAQNNLCAYADPSDPTETGCVPVSNVFASNPSLRNLDPRVGFALDPFKDHATAIRGGVAIFHDPLQVRNYNAGFLFTKPYQAAVQPCVPGLPPCEFPTPFVGIAAPLALSIQAQNYHSTTTPYLIQYNLSIQRQITPTVVLSVAYIGSKGENLDIQNDLNPPIPNIVNETLNFAGALPGTETISDSTARPNPNYGAMDANSPVGQSWYNSLQIYLTRNLGKTVQFQANYTYSKCLDVGSNSIGAESSNSQQGQYDPYDLGFDRGLCDFNVANSLTANAVYSFPFQQNVLVKGWQYSIIANAHTGTPFTVFDGFDRADLNNSAGLGGDERPDLIPGESSNPVVGSAAEWYNPASFALQAPGALGDLRRNSIAGPGFADFDMTLGKMTQLTEQLGMQFRFEVFNAINHPNFSLPDQTLYLGPACVGDPTGLILGINCPGAGVPNPDAGYIHSTVSSSRQLQFGLKFLF